MSFCIYVHSRVEYLCGTKWPLWASVIVLDCMMVSFLTRSLPIDMAGFAVRVELIVAKPNVLIGVDKSRKRSKLGYLESDFLENFVSRDTVECRGNNKEVFTVYIHVFIYSIAYLPYLASIYPCIQQYNAE